MSINILIKASRGPFLLLTPICILMGYTLAKLTTPDINLLHLSLITIGAIFAHMSVNFLNEYEDFCSGLDLKTTRTPFSGGSGALPDNPQGKKLVLMAAIFSLFMVFVIGIYFMYSIGWPIVTFGMTGVILIVTYTRWVNRIAWLCLLAPGFGFGILMVLASVWLLAGHISHVSGVLSLIPFLQINNLLLLNQLPDIEADKSIGRNHAAIAYGVPWCSKFYAVFMILPFIIIALLTLTGNLPILSLVTLLLIPLGITVAKATASLGANIGQQPKYLGMNVALTLITPLLLSISMLLS